MRRPMFVYWSDEKENKKEGKNSDCLGVKKRDEKL